MSSLRRHRRAVDVAVFIGCVAANMLPAGAGWAHGGPIALEMWGGFPPTAAYCQRIIGVAAAGCALQAARLRQQCLDATSRGMECNEAATTAAIAEVRRNALDLVDLHCSDLDARTLGYLSISFDLPNDIVKFCREWEDESASAVYGTVLPGNAPLDAQTYACVTATATAAAKLSQRIFDTWRETLDRVAVRSWDLATKTSTIDNGSERVAAIESRAAERLSSQCAPAGFESIYHRSAATLIDDLTIRANCFAPAFYVQDKLICPPAVCGNWIIEPGETCDDGNTDGGDGCDSECARP